MTYKVMLLYAEALFNCYTKQIPPKVAVESDIKSSNDDNPNEGSNKDFEM